MHTTCAFTHVCKKTISIVRALPNNFFKPNSPETEEQITIGGTICHFGHKDRRFKRMKELVSEILHINIDNDISHEVADFPYIRKQSGSCTIHCDSYDRLWEHKHLVSAAIYLEATNKPTFNIWKEGKHILQKTRIPDPFIQVAVMNGDIFFSGI